MKRRDFLTAAPALCLTTPAWAYSALTYAPSTWPDIRETHERVILNFTASWSLTCKRKRDILSELLATEPAYQSLTFLDVNWDIFARARWTERLNVKRRSTLIALHNGKEVARLVNEPNENAIRSFLDAALRV